MRTCRPRNYVCAGGSRYRKLRTARLKEQGLPLPKPQTIDSQRTRDETFVSEDDPEVIEDERCDEFAELLSGSEPPSLLITTCPKPSKATHTFVKELEFSIVPPLHQFST